MRNYEGYPNPLPDKEAAVNLTEISATLSELLTRAGDLALRHTELPPTASFEERIKLHDEAARFRAAAEFVEQFTEEYQVLTA
jgi:hypothetical protein